MIKNNNTLISNRIKPLCYYISYDTRKHQLRVCSGIFITDHNWIYPLESSEGLKLSSKSENVCISVLGKILSNLNTSAECLVNSQVMIDNLVNSYIDKLKV